MALLLRTILLSLLVGPGMTGCQKSGPRLYPVSGTVNFDDKPLDAGTITLFPQDQQGPAAQGRIQDGKFSLQAAPGLKIVSIEASRPTPGQTIREGQDVAMEQYLPSAYNRESTLIADIPVGGTSALTFQLSHNEK